MDNPPVPRACDVTSSGGVGRAAPHPWVGTPAPQGDVHLGHNPLEALDVARHLDVRAEPPQHGARPWTLAVLYRVEGEVQRYGIVVDIAKVWHAAGCVCL